MVLMVSFSDFCQIPFLDVWSFFESLSWVFTGVPISTHGHIYIVCRLYRCILFIHISTYINICIVLFLRPLGPPKRTPFGWFLCNQKKKKTFLWGSWCSTSSRSCRPLRFQTVSKRRLPPSSLGKYSSPKCSTISLGTLEQIL